MLDFSSDAPEALLEQRPPLRTLLCLNRINAGQRELQKLIRLSASRGEEWPRALKDESLREAVFGAVRSKSFEAEPERLGEAERYLDSGRVTLVSLWDESYPARLREIASPPLALWVEGNPQLLSRPQVAVVGTRRPSAHGLQNAYEFSKALAQEGYVITSGLALGVDKSAHEGALSAGTTLAVLGAGLGSDYPKENQSLRARIREEGAVVSEFFPDRLPYPQNFPQRNRVVSGLSLAVLVIEAPKKSGTLITARIALEQNRDVFAVPASIDLPSAEGSNALIAEGAQVALSPENLKKSLRLFQGDEPSLHVNPEPQPSLALEEASDLTDLQRAVLAHLTPSPKTLEELQALTQKSEQELSLELLILETMQRVQTRVCDSVVQFMRVQS